MANSTHKKLPGTYSDDGQRRHFLRRFSQLAILAVTLLVVWRCRILPLDYSSPVSYRSSSIPRRLTPPEFAPPTPATESENDDGSVLIRVLQKATMSTMATTSSSPSIVSTRTVILVVITDALAKPGSLLDLFLESFWMGNETQELLRNLVIVSLDEKAHKRCQAVHPHCFAMITPLTTERLKNLTGEAFYMTPEYFAVVWSKVKLVASVLRLGYDLILTDADILWFRNPFPHLTSQPAADIYISCDGYEGDSSDLYHNAPNAGWFFMKSNNKTIRFLDYWYDSKDRYPGKKTQDIFSCIIRSDPVVKGFGLQFRFLSTAYFGGFCQPVCDFDLAITIHSNCCFGLGAKVHSLRNVLRDWKRFSSDLPADSSNSTSVDWRAPRLKCGH